MEFKKRVLKFKFDGNEYEIKFPSVGIIKDHAESLKEIGGIVDFLASLGLPKEVCLEMETDHLEKILEELTKKKSQVT